MNLLNKHDKKRSWWRRGVRWLGLVLLLLTGISVYLIFFKHYPGEETIPAGYQRNSSHQITMRDGTKLAVDVWLPSDLQADQQIPAVMEITRYWRAMHLGPLYRLMLGLGQEKVPNLAEATLWNTNGYALILVDARGSGASEGQRPVEWSDAEVADYAEVIEWITQQPWSNQHVGAYGVSYSGNTAELTTISHHPALKAVAPLYSDFDPQFFLAMPGGVYNQMFIEQWNMYNQALDTNDVCTAEHVSGIKCWVTKLFIPGVKPVTGADLEATVATHTTLDLASTLAEISYRDDSLPDGISIGSVSLYGRLPALEKAQIPMLVRVGWFDAATVDGALSRYLSSDQPQTLLIGALSHGGGHNTDPFHRTAWPDPTPKQQTLDLVAFFDHYLKQQQPTPSKRIRYYTMNEAVWRETTVWPPAEVEPQRWYLDIEQQLTPQTPHSSGQDSYVVDWSATSGTENRWKTNLTGDAVHYPNQAEQAQKLLTYTSAPLSTDIRITGNPKLTINLASTHTDGALHVYLQAVAPDGEVLYLTEGILRLIHRESNELPYIQAGGQQSYLESDARPLTPNVAEQHTIGLYATSVTIPAGYRLQIAIAGHDADTFARYPATGTPTYTVVREPTTPSYLSLPVAEEQ